MSIWTLLLLAPFVTSAGVLVATLAGIPAPAAALALAPLVFGAALVFAAGLLSVEAAVLAAAIVVTVLITVLSRRQTVRQR